MFIHLHNHTDYSLLDGAARISGYVSKAKELGMEALAITDHGNMYGALTFYNACRKAGIKPIIGCEFYVSPGSRFDKNLSKGEDRYHHLILLAMNDEGYRNLMKLNSIAWTEGFYYKPRIDHECIEKYNAGLICLSACVAGELPRTIVRDGIDKAMEVASWFKGVFGDRYYLEIQRHGILEEETVTDAIVRHISPTLGIPVVCTNDIHYIEKEDWDAHDTLLCIGTRALKSDADRLRYEKGEFYFRTEDEMRELFHDVPESVDVSGKIAERCNLEIAFPGPVLPKCPIPPEYENDAQWLRALAFEGLPKRYPDAGGEFLDSLKRRLEDELDTIIQMDFPAYFLIVQDYINWAKRNGISVGPGRGSGAGSLVAYCIGITDIDPIRFGLLFERFLNRERVSLPDFDVDFSDARREEVIEYVKERYGNDHVGQIATFGTLKAKAVVKDVARVMGFSPQEANQLTALIPDAIPDKKDVFLADAIECTPILADYLKDERYARLFETALKLEGMARHVSLHAAGIVIGKDPLDTYVPLCMPDQNGRPASQYPMTQIEDCGLVKMDFLGLKTLTLIDHAVELVRQRVPEFDITRVPDNDPKTMTMLQNGDSSLVFQFESKGMQDVLKKAVPVGIDDLVALNALYRPGPMQFIEKFIEGRHHPEKITYPDPALEDLLKPTYGVIVYQEQVMKAAQIIAGYSLGQADILRRIMGKKKKEALAAELEKFIAGAVAKGYSKEHAEEIFHILEPFAGYGFNKSHAVAYTMIAYRTAYLKAHYPAEFLAANLTNEIGTPDKFVEYLTLAEKKKMKVLPPGINTSLRDFSIEDGCIRYGLAGIRDIGPETAETIVAERNANGPYTSFSDFIRRTDKANLNTRVVKALILSGCFDEERADLLSAHDEIIKVERKRRSESEMQMSLFEDDSDYVIPAGTPKPNLEWLELEKEYLGAYLTGHPLDEYPEELVKSVRESDGRIRTMGLVISRKDPVTKEGKQMCVFTIRTAKSTQECVVFPNRYECVPADFREGGVYLIHGRTSIRNGSLSFIVDFIEDVPSDTGGTVA